MVEEKDRTLKLISKYHLHLLLEILNKNTDMNISIDSEIEILTDEQIYFEPSLLRPDFIVRIGNLILMVEFQSTELRFDYKKRFKLYITFFDYKNNKDNRKILFAVLPTAQHSQTVKELMNDGDYFTFPIVSLIDIDEREIISNIKEKVKKTEKH